MNYIECTKCGRRLEGNHFFTYKNDDYFPICKQCLRMQIDNQDPTTYLWLLKELNVPYIKNQWTSTFQIHGENSNIIGRYLAKMRLKGFCMFTWEDTLKIEQDKLTEEEIAYIKQEVKV